MTTIEELAKKYYEYTGDAPAYSFWSWLEAMGVEPTEKSLRAALKDEEIWQDFEE